MQHEDDDPIHLMGVWMEGVELTNVRPYAGDDEGLLGPRDRRQPGSGGLQQRGRGAGQGVQELGVARAGQRPQTGTAAAGEDDGVKHRPIVPWTPDSHTGSLRDSCF